VGRRAVLGVVVVAVALLGGCTKLVSGSPVPVDESERKPTEIKAEDVLGDYASVDACSLIEPDTFTDFGDSEYAYHYSLDYCEVDVTESGGDTFMSAGQLFPLKTIQENIVGPPLQELDGDLWVGQGADDDTHCVQYVVFADDVAMAVDAYIYDEHSSDQLCAMVESAVKGVVDVVGEDSVRHRDLKKDSFAKLDACDVVPKGTVEGVPLLAGVTDQEQSLSGHFCRWTSGDENAPELNVTFGSDQPGDGADKAQASEIDGRPTMTTLQDTWCEVKTEHIPVETEGKDDGYVEVASVTVYGSGGAPMCDAATAVATKVWPELPEA
jgi:intracellular sulfur oxidation DsrE/DsrF family protein